MPGSPCHIPLDLDGPVYVGDPNDGSLLISSYNNSLVYKLWPQFQRAQVLIYGKSLGLRDLHNCEPDHEGNIWVNGVLANKVWCFSPKGELLDTLGDGQAGFQTGTVSWEDVRFSNIFDLRRGPDGIYLVDSGNYAVRRIDTLDRTVTTVAGTGQPGYSGDGGPAALAALGGKPGEKFDGPWSLAVDEEGNLYIGDTQNGVVRMVAKADGIITTIAGRKDPIPSLRNNPRGTDPLRVNLPRICSLDYHQGKLFIPEWDGDLVVLKRTVGA